MIVIQLITGAIALTAATIMSVALGNTLVTYSEQNRIKDFIVKHRDAILWTTSLYFAAALALR